MSYTSYNPTVVKKHLFPVSWKIRFYIVGQWALLVSFKVLMICVPCISSRFWRKDATCCVLKQNDWSNPLAIFSIDIEHATLSTRQLLNTGSWYLPNGLIVHTYGTYVQSIMQIAFVPGSPLHVVFKRLILCNTMWLVCVSSRKPSIVAQERSLLRDSSHTHRKERNCINLLEGAYSSQYETVASNLSCRICSDLCRNIFYILFYIQEQITLVSHIQHIHSMRFIIFQLNS